MGLSDGALARARRNRNRTGSPVIYKPAKTHRRVWSLDDYAQVLVHREGLTPKQARYLVVLVLSLLRQILLRGDVVSLPGVGRLYIRYSATRKGFGDLEGEYGYIPETAKLIFKTSPHLRREMRARARYFRQFNDAPMLFRVDDLPVVEYENAERNLDVENFVVQQGWEDAEGKVRNESTAGE